MAAAPIPGGELESHWPVVSELLPLLDCASEREGWCRVVEIAAKLFDAERAVVLERLDEDRVIVRSSIGLSTLTPDRMFAIAPDSQATFAFDSPVPVRSDDIRVDDRFVGGRLLTEVGIVSSMSVPFVLPDDRTALISLHSMDKAAFRHQDLRFFATMGNFCSLVLRRIRRRVELERGAHFDPLTGLANRFSILAELAERIRTGADVAAMIIDLDGFKAVNDDLGHGTGDEVLRSVAARLDRALSPDDRLGRLGGDEFLLVTTGSDLESRSERLVGHVEEAILVDDRLVQISASVGIARLRRDESIDSVIERADRLMYEAKAAGRGEVCLDTVVRECDDTSVVCATRTRPPGPTVGLRTVDEAIARLRLAYQPIVDASTHEVCAVEALTRGPNDHALEFPDPLFAAATTFGRTGDLELASKTLAFTGDIPAGIDLYVNLEPALLSDPVWVERLTDVWNASGCSVPVVAELTERAVLRSPGHLLRAVDVCRSLGWRIALDDVGSRSESLAALRWIRPDVVKLDMGLIDNDNRAHCANIVAAIDTYRHIHDDAEITVVAEGVETELHERRAALLGADRLQGYRFGRPGPIEGLRVDRAGQPRATGRSPQHGRRVATKRELLHLSRHVEAGALSADCVLVSAIQHVDHLSPHTQRQYRALARRCGFVGMVGVGLSCVGGSEMRGVRVSDLDPRDPMTRNWYVVAMSPSVSIGLLATEVATSGAHRPDMERLFSYELITDEHAVEDAAKRLLNYF